MPWRVGAGLWLQLTGLDRRLALAVLSDPICSSQPVGNVDGYSRLGMEQEAHGAALTAQVLEARHGT